MEVYGLIKQAIEDKLFGIGAQKIEFYNEQYLNMEEETATNYPAAYIEILDPVVWKQLSRKIQVADMTIRLHCVTYDVRDTLERSLEFSQKVLEALSGQRLYLLVNVQLPYVPSGDPDNPTEPEFDSEPQQLSTELVRVSSNMPKRYNQLKVMHIDFRCEVMDSSLVQKLTPVGGVDLITTEVVE